MPQIEYDNGKIQTGQLPSGQWTAFWTGPDGKGFGRMAGTEAEALTLLQEALSAARAEGGPVDGHRLREVMPDAG